VKQDTTHIFVKETPIPKMAPIEMWQPTNMLDFLVFRAGPTCFVVLLHHIKCVLFVVFSDTNLYFCEFRETC